VYIYGVGTDYDESAGESLCVAAELWREKYTLGHYCLSTIHHLPYLTADPIRRIATLAEKSKHGFDDEIRKAVDGLTGNEHADDFSLLRLCRSH
jgi:hypothetical protein